MNLQIISADISVGYILMLAIIFFIIYHYFFESSSNSSNSSSNSSNSSSNSSSNYVTSERDPPIDAVFTWVDGQDPDHLEKRLYWSDKTKHHVEEVFDTNQSYRYESIDEIKYSVISVLRYLPWVRTVYIVTDNQKPPVDLNHPKIKLIDHKEIIPHEHLPTFNSHAIEAHLWRIPNLSRYYLYLNDDCFINKHMTKDRFLKNGKIQLAFNKIKLTSDNLKVTKDMKAYYIGGKNAYKLLETIYPRSERYYTFHHAILYDKKIHEEIWKLFPVEMQRTSQAKFRSLTDVSPNILASWMAIEKGLAEVGSFNSQYYTLRKKMTEKRFQRMVNRIKNSELFCLNDSIASNAPQVQKLLNTIYSTPN